jgi:magnesium-transporting ATPase (P-type)
MKIEVKVDTKSPSNNYISYNKFNLFDIPKISIYKYFLESTENLYFLALSLFQLLTYDKINILPPYWSPSGPFSTLIPLLLCYLLEVINLLITYFTDLYKTYKYNYYKYAKFLRNNNIETDKLKNIKVGDLILIDTNEIVPVDAVLFSLDTKDYAHISLSNLNGECDIICKDPIINLHSGFSDNDYDLNISISDVTEYSNSIKKFNARCNINDMNIKLNSNHFIPGGAINKGNCFILLVTQIGKNIRSYTSNKNEKLFKQNFIDNYITYSLTNYFIFLLALFTISITIQKNSDLNLFNMLKSFIQSWILLNGVVPFSAKIIVMLNRSIQSYLESNDSVDYILPNSLDNFHQIDRIICDKTGTITKNELLLTHLSYKNKIYIDDYETIPFHLLYNVVLSLHYKNEIYATEEDRIISDKILSLGTIIESNMSQVEITNNNYSGDKVKVDIIEMNKLEFDCNRKMSSVIYKNNEKYYIISKGSLSAIKEILAGESISDFEKDKKEYDIKYPYLRTIAIAMKEIQYSSFDNPTKYENEGDYYYLTILGIQDELQEDVINTVSNLVYNKKQISICTGDRYETAVYIGGELNILGNIVTLKSSIEDIYMNEYTFIFNSHDILLSISNADIMDKFTYLLINSNNFIGYSMIPKDKQFISNLFEMNKINIIAVGDGNNDIPMLKTSTVGIGVKNGLNTNVVSNSQITISRFKDLLKVNKNAYFCYTHNYNSIYSVFYKIILIHTLVYLYIINNDYNLNDILFNFIEIQGNHLLWGVIPVIMSNYFYYNTLLAEKNNLVIISFIFALCNALLIMKLKYYTIMELSEKQMILLLAVVSINLKFMLIFGCRVNNLISCILSILIGVSYIFYFSN